MNRSDVERLRMFMYICSATTFQWLVIPFAMTHPAVTPISQTASAANSWIGEVKADVSIGLYLDQMVSVVLGVIPFQVSL